MLIIHLERLNNMVPADRPDIIRYISDSQNVATRLLENLRKIIWDLRPSILDDLGLVAAIRWFARTNLEKAGVRVDFWVDNEEMRLPTPLETMLFRIAQEAISNIVRHANASLVSIRLWVADASIWLEVKDNGCGFDLENISASNPGRKPLGLLGIRERASLVHGDVKINSSELGTCLQVHLPVPELAPVQDSVQ
jgi:signal transduction histidine kinase